ncbi:MAG: adenylate/guanylate cyclase domain-containing protein [Oceanococcus sp.]
MQGRAFSGEGLRARRNRGITVRIEGAISQAFDESEYGEWRLEKSVAPTRLLMALAIPAWFFLPFIAPPPAGGIIPEAFYWFCWAYMTPMCLLGFVTDSSPWRQHAYLLALLGFPGGALGTMWLMADFWGSPHGIAASGVWYCLISSFVRLPPKYTLCLALSVTVAAAWVLLEYLSLPMNQIWVDLIYLAFGAVLIGVFSFMNESLLRQSFMQQQTIARQHVELLQRQQETEASRNLIRRYIPPAVADQIIAGNEAAIAEPKRQRVTVLFSDIVGFTDIADRVEPEVMTQVLSEYMSSMAGLIDAHGGTLNEFAGDGLMALFGAPDAMLPEDQACSAVNAAMAMQRKMPELNEQWRKLGLGAELKVRIGINTGMVSVGSYGSEGRMTYTAIGLQTNIASRIESKAEPGEILISDASYQLISGQIECEPRGEVDCKGVHFPVQVYAPQASA